MSAIEPAAATDGGADRAMSRSAIPMVLLLLCGTALGLAGIDLVLPAVPGLPEQLDGSRGMAQLVVSAYVLGTALGLISFGALSSVVAPRWLLVGAFTGLGVTSFLCAIAPSLEILVLIRLIQGLLSAAPAVLAPALLRRAFSPATALRALGMLSSVEALVPALAPIAGAGLVSLVGWNGPFVTMAVAAAVVGICIALLRRSMPAAVMRPGAGSFAALLRKGMFLRLALSQALTLGGLLVFVFGAPAVIEHNLGGGIGHYLALQGIGVFMFIIAANLSSILTRRYGARPVIVAGSLLAASGGAGLVVFALAGGSEPLLLIPLWLPVSIGLGLRGPAAFMEALDVAADDERGAAVILLLHTTLAAAGNAVVAMFLESGLIALTIVSAVMLVTALALVGRRTSDKSEQS
ncbi:MFS transporter [Kribbella turkmenica]|nr:MFS transporter [Kribbella turkmenica]